MTSPAFLTGSQSSPTSSTRFWNSMRRLGRRRGSSCQPRRLQPSGRPFLSERMWRARLNPSSQPLGRKSTKTRVPGNRKTHQSMPRGCASSSTKELALTRETNMGLPGTRAMCWNTAVRSSCLTKPVIASNPMLKKTTNEKLSGNNLSLKKNFFALKGLNPFFIFVKKLKIKIFSQRN